MLCNEKLVHPCPHDSACRLARRLPRPAPIARCLCSLPAGVPAQPGAQEALHAGCAGGGGGRAQRRAGGAAGGAGAALHRRDRGLRRRLEGREAPPARVCHVHRRVCVRVCVCAHAFAPCVCIRVCDPLGGSVFCPPLLESIVASLPYPPCLPCLPADSQHSDIPVPDFTYNCYPETRYKNSSWPAIKELLQRKSDMLHWHERHSALFHRSNWGVGPRRGLMPLLQSYANGSGAPPAAPPVSFAAFALHPSSAAPHHSLIRPAILT